MTSNTRLLLLFFLMISTTISCKKIWDKNPTANQDSETLIHDGETREYLIHIPSSYDGSVEVPLLFNFHGYGSTATDHMNDADMRDLADEEGFILVYPQGALLDGSPHWNSGLPSPDNKSDVDDFGFIEALIDELSANYTIDSKRIYACGYSNGSFFSYALACYHSDRIAAIGSVSGAMMEETNTNCAPTHPVPVINLHGTSDGVVPYDGGEGVTSVDNMLNYWINFNNTDTNPTTNSITTNGTTIEYYHYANGDNNTAIEHYKIIDGGHVWFDIDYNGANTNQLIWDFVSQYNIDGLM